MYENELLTLLSNPEAYKQKIKDLQEASQDADAKNKELSLRKIELEDIQVRTESQLQSIQSTHSEVDQLRKNLRITESNLKRREEQAEKLETEIKNKEVFLEKKEKALLDRENNSNKQMIIAAQMRDEGLALKQQFENKMAQLRTIGNF